MARRRAVFALAGALLLALAAVWLLRARSDGALVARQEQWPAGRWHLALEGMSAAGGSRAAEEAARTLSLPYSAGGARAGGRHGVVFHDRARAFPGLNLYVSGHAPEAWLVDMEGRPLHRWRCPFARAFPGKRPDAESGYFRRARLLPDGTLLALFQGAGVVRLDRASRLLAAYDAGFYNDLDVDAAGNLWGLTKEARRIPELGREEPVLEDFLVELAPDGRPLRRLSLIRALQRSPFASLLRPLGPTADIFHGNTVEVLGAVPGAPEPFRPGNVLVSLREVDIVAVLDPRRGAVLWARRGPWRAQHQPTLLPGGRLLLFDNRGYHGHSRVLELDLASGTVVWEFHGDPPARFSSPEAGSSQRLPNGDTLITESERGRAFEVTPAGEVVWELRSPHRAGPHGELVATLFEVVRLPEGYLTAGWKPGEETSP
jgi:hypothetical protein